MTSLPDARLTALEQKDAIPGAHFTDVGLELDRSLSFERWEQLGSTLGRIHRCSSWWVGDWCNFGERAFGEKYSQAIEATGLDYSALRNYAWVASRVEVSRRRDNLSFSHHQAVAGLEPAEQDEWLERAEQDKWTRNDLRGALRELLPSEQFTGSQARELVPDETELLETLRELRDEHGEKLTAEKVRSAVTERLRREQVVGFMLSSESTEWYTPGLYIEAARFVLGGIELDPASSARANETVLADRFYSEADDGLAQPWRGRVWLNPPYGRLIAPFLSRLLLSFDAGDVSAAVLLVTAHGTDTDWFQPLWDFPLCFTDHRINFTNPLRAESTASTHGSVFAYLGPDASAFTSVFRRFGAIVERRQDASTLPELRAAA